MSIDHLAAGITEQRQSTKKADLREHSKRRQNNILTEKPHEGFPVNPVPCENSRDVKFIKSMSKRVNDSLVNKAAANKLSRNKNVIIFTDS